jgi:hypothetical protein
VACNFEKKIFDWFTTCLICTHKSGCGIYRSRKQKKACICVFQTCSSVSLVHSGGYGNQFPTIEIICFISKVSSTYSGNPHRLPSLKLALELLFLKLKRTVLENVHSFLSTAEVNINGAKPPFSNMPSWNALGF